ncbi:transporter substrate-binding domain-containing protein [Nakamurella flavida]|uniref:Transporter substrate-binding domain-containing protein n=1 Tax=Nakamurella flavida TaxID=363630 RepID=A0A938YMW2_9ACTN|nr:transporter substrate-binding domain-containing protein [Nakamurella flavida]MBM9476292.1 transporter substrate-binding domain-containing protein [Nakamurella flavida]MDP9779608.1 polar amino acid transport system substrate-binding protein [Nakamurella flavida]
MKRITAAAALAAAALTLAACGSSSTTAGSSASSATSAAASAGSSATSGSAASGSAVAAPAGLISDGEVSLCIDPEYAPMEYYENGTSGDPIGFDADGARALAELWGLPLTFQVTTFDGLMPALQAKRCDILWSALYMSEERLQVADATAFMNTGPGLIVPTGSAIATADDLSGKTVAVQGGGANEKTLVDLSAEFEAAGKAPITVQPYPKTAETVAAVTNGKADALIETDVACADMVSKSGGKLTIAPGVFPTETQFGVFTVKGSPMSAAVAEGIATLTENGTLATIAEKYGLDPSKIPAAS